MTQVAVSDFNSATGDTSALTIPSHTVAAGEALIVAAILSDRDGSKDVNDISADDGGTPEDMGSATYDIDMSGFDKRIEVFHLISPAAFTNGDIVITMSGGNAQKIIGMAWSVTNPHQTTLLSLQVSDDNSSGTSFSVSVTQQADDLALLIGGNNKKETMDPDNSETEHVDVDVEGNYQGGGWSLDGGPTLGCSGWASDKNGCIGFLVNAAPSGVGIPIAAYHHFHHNLAS